ncbi:MAG TPA: hypothetical protein VFY36_05160 [Solirubrobacteraceae bacterium]|nr:hypothetical protein [Solirubrobacteraceae bacterium]
MPEYEPFKGREKKLEPTEAALKGPNVISTLDSEPHPDAVKAQDAAIRRHLKGQRPAQDPPSAA